MAEKKKPQLWDEQGRPLTNEVYWDDELGPIDPTRNPYTGEYVGRAEHSRANYVRENAYVPRTNTGPNYQPRAPHVPNRPEYQNQDSQPQNQQRQN